MRRQFLHTALFATLALAAGLGASAQTSTLRVSAIPDEAPTELQRKFKPLGDYLKKATGLDVQFTPVTDYAAVVEGLATNKIDLAWLGGFTFVQAKLRTDGRRVPIVQRAEDEVFTSKFIVPTDSTAKTLADLKGSTFAFGAPSSTSGSLMPRYFLHAGRHRSRQGLQDRGLLRRARRHGGLRRRRPGRGRRAQRLGVGQAGRGRRTRTPPRCACWPPRRPTTTTTGRCAPASTRR